MTEEGEDRRVDQESRDRIDAIGEEYSALAQTFLSFHKQIRFILAFFLALIIACLVIETVLIAENADAARDVCKQVQVINGNLEGTVARQATLINTKGTASYKFYHIQHPDQLPSVESEIAQEKKTFKPRKC